MNWYSSYDQWKLDYPEHWDMEELEPEDDKEEEYGSEEGCTEATEEETKWTWGETEGTSI